MFGLPAIIIILAVPVFTALFILLLGTTKYYSKKIGYRLTVITLLILVYLLSADLSTAHSTLLFKELFNEMLIYDTYSTLFILLFILGTFLSLSIGKSYIYKSDIFTPESFSLILFSLFGMILLAMTNELLSAFIALEIASLSVYVLVGIHHHSLRASEAFFKYLLLGSFAGSFYLLGLMLIYAQVGSTHFNQIAMFMYTHPISEIYLIVAGGLLLMITIMFKIAAMPFGAWVLDVYEGASLPITAFMAGTFKIAIFAIALRLFIGIFAQIKDFYDPLIVASAILTLVSGSLLAMVQTNIKRMLAASSIVHSGYLLIGLSSIGEIGTYATQSILFYLIAYFISATGALGILAYISNGVEKEISYDSLKGLGRQHPFLSAALTVFMLSLAGFPSTIGFLGKFYIFTSAIEAGYTLLALLGILAAFVSIYYYFKVISMLYFYEAEGEKVVYGEAYSFLFIMLSSVAVLWGGIGTGLVSFMPGANAITDITHLVIESLYIFSN